MRIAITIPIYVTKQEHVDYLNQTTASIYSENTVVFIPVENYVDPSLLPMAYVFAQEPKEIHIIPGGEPQSVSRAWNFGIQKGIDTGCEYIIIMNSDIVLKRNSIDRLVTFAESHQDAIMWTMSEWAELSSIQEANEDENYSEHPHFSCFMVKKDFFNHVGKFDEHFTPAYLEDNDMAARIAKANLKAYVYGGSRFYHHGSRTIKTDSELWRKNSYTFPKNQNLFVKKWGHPVVNEPSEMRRLYYDHPFNNPHYQLSTTDGY